MIKINTLNLTNATAVDQLTSPLLAHTKDAPPSKQQGTINARRNRIPISRLQTQPSNEQILKSTNALFLALFSHSGAGVLRNKTVILNTHNICIQKSHGIICLNTEYVAPFYKGEGFA
jgi:hypothetical protein